MRPVQRNIRARDMAHQELGVLQVADTGELHSVAQRVHRIWQVYIMLNSDTVRATTPRI